MEFRAVLAEGTFFIPTEGDDSLYFVNHKGQGVHVEAELSPLCGKRVRLSAHHLPENPPDPTKWGGGSCLWQRCGVTCPAGHHLHPEFMFNFSMEGVLSREGEGWWVEKFDGTRVELPLQQQMPGHTGRIAAATVVDIEAMKTALGSGQLVEDLTARAGQLHDLLDAVRRKP